MKKTIIFITAVLLCTCTASCSKTKEKSQENTDSPKSYTAEKLSKRVRKTSRRS
ncbi:MAG: hypothetical protein K2O29_11800 [Ruminococcus sp.]|nr:hypothetical protein [Ruminococcus sp.]MDE6848599.1 hypothetical protein [Ruminococcus sp.]MDE7139111.1 hypothetical protein [Ruminococcus sp.]